MKVQCDGVGLILLILYSSLIMEIDWIKCFSSMTRCVCIVTLNLLFITVLFLTYYYLVAIGHQYSSIDLLLLMYFVYCNLKDLNPVLDYLLCKIGCGITYIRVLFQRIEDKGKDYGSYIKSGKLRWFVRETGKPCTGFMIVSFSFSFFPDFFSIRCW